MGSPSLKALVKERKILRPEYDPTKDVFLSSKGSLPNSANDPNRTLDAKLREACPNYNASSLKDRSTIVDEVYTSVSGVWIQPSKDGSSVRLLNKDEAVTFIKKRFRNIKLVLQTESKAVMEKFDESSFSKEERLLATEHKDTNDLVFSVPLICRRKLLEDPNVMLSLSSPKQGELWTELRQMEHAEMALLVGKLRLLDPNRASEALSFLQSYLGGGGFPEQHESSQTKRAIARLSTLTNLNCNCKLTEYKRRGRLEVTKRNLASDRAADTLALCRLALEGDKSKESQQLLHALELEANEMRKLSPREMDRILRQESKKMYGKTLDERLQEAIDFFVGVPFGFKS